MVHARSLRTIKGNALAIVFVEGFTADLVTPVGDANAIATALVRLLTDPDLATRMGEAGRHRAETSYDRDYARAGRTTTRIHLPA